MRVFVTGATGALGRHLVPGLIAAGHEVTATTRAPGKVALLRAVGAEATVVDGLDREAVIAAVRAAAPDDQVRGQNRAAGGSGGHRAALRRLLRAGASDVLLDMVRKRQIPVIGGGTGIWSFIEISDAAAATLAAVERGAPGVYNVVDDDPAPVAEWPPGSIATCRTHRPPVSRAVRHLPATARG